MMLRNGKRGAGDVLGLSARGKRARALSSPFVDVAIGHRLLESFLSYLGDTEGIYLLRTNKDAFWEGPTLNKIAIASFSFKGQIETGIRGSDHCTIGNNWIPSYLVPECLTNTRIQFNRGCDPSSGDPISFPPLLRLTIMRLEFHESQWGPRSSRTKISNFPTSFPESLTSLEITNWPHLIPWERLPSSLVSLDLVRCDRLESLQSCVLPSSLRTLKFGQYGIDNIVPGVFPESLTHLEFGLGFTEPLTPGILPSGLTSLKLGNCQQRLIMGCFPSSLTYLDLCGYFNQPIEPGVLPDSITELHFGEHFRQQFDRIHLPTSLVTLVLGAGFHMYDRLRRSQLPLSLVSVVDKDGNPIPLL